MSSTPGKTTFRWSSEQGAYGAAFKYSLACDGALGMLWSCCGMKTKALPALPCKSRCWDEIKAIHGSTDPGICGRAGGSAQRNPPGCGSGRAGPPRPLPIPALASRHSRARRCRASPAVCQEPAPRAGRSPAGQPGWNSVMERLWNSLTVPQARQDCNKHLL